MTQTNLALKKLKGIKPKGVKHNQVDNSLTKFRDEFLLEELYGSKWPRSIGAYNEMYWRAKCRLADFEYDANDLTIFLNNNLIS